MPIKGVNNERFKQIESSLSRAKKNRKMVYVELGKDTSTVSKWCSNKMQPSLEILMRIAKILDVDIRELIITTKR